MDEPLFMSTVIALGATAGLGRSHHTFFYDFYSIIPWGLIDHDLKAKPLARAYQLLAGVVAGGADRLAVTGFESGRLDGGLGAVLAARDAGGVTRVLLINRGPNARTARIDVKGTPQLPRRIQSLDDPAQIRSLPPQVLMTVPPRAIVVVEL